MRITCCKCNKDYRFSENLFNSKELSSIVLICPHCNLSHTIKFEISKPLLAKHLEKILALKLSATELDYMEYSTDANAQAAYVTNGGVSTAAYQYPIQDADHVKATSTYGANFYPYFCTDPTKSLINGNSDNAWAASANTNQRFHIDLGLAKTITKIYYENSHETGDQEENGSKNFTFWGSNSASSFAELTYATDTGWTQLTIDDSTFDQHVALNQADPKYVNVTNTTAYRYYAFKIADNWSGASVIQIRRIELYGTIPATLQSYSEATIKTQGSYSLKGVAAITDSNAKTLTRTIA